MRSRKPSARSPRSDHGPPRAGYLLGLDLGATKVAAIAVDGSGRPLAPPVYVRHANDGPTSVLRRVAQAARVSMPEGWSRPRAVGLSIAAQVDARTGLVHFAPNLRWRRVPAGARLARALGQPVRVVNDGRAGAYAEWRRGAGAGCDDVFVLMMGTGIGGSAVVGGRLLEGGTNAAGEVGHLPIVSGGRPCHCPGAGCFEAYVGGWGIASRARDAVRADPVAGRALVARAGSLRRLSAETVFAADRAGDPVAHRLVRETERYFRDGVVGVANAFNPSRFVIAGGLAAGHPAFVRIAARSIRDRCQPPAARAIVRPARFGPLAPAIGAALYAATPSR
jgi:glucokinase